MGEQEGRVGYKDWDKIVKIKENSLKVIEANKRNIEVGEMIEQLILDKALMERSKYPEPEPETMAEDETPEDTPESTEEKAE